MAKAGGRDLRAAGTVVVRTEQARAEVMLVHRVRYDDWSLPKGKLRPDESWPVAAVRETREETGFAVRLGAPAGVLTYKVKGRPKEVRFWMASTLGEQGARTGAEVDAVGWFPVDKAITALQHKAERDLVRASAGLPPTVPLVIVRHAKALSRKRWRASDPARPLAGRGNGQALRLVSLLAVWSPGAIVSSPSRRCADTIEPYAAAVGGKVELEPTLSEEEFAKRPDELVRLIGDTASRLREELARGGSPGEADLGVVLCTHRPLLPTIADTLGIPLADAYREEALPTGGCWVLHLNADATLAIEEHRS